MLIEAYHHACKDFHYFCKDYARHLLADAVMADDLHETMDAIKENLMIANGVKPLPSKLYLLGAAKIVPMEIPSDSITLRRLLAMAAKIEEMVNDIDLNSRSANVLLDTISDAMSHARTLLTIELRSASIMEAEEDSYNLDEALEEAVKVLHDHKAATETPVDRKEIKAIYPDGEKVAKRVLDYEAQNVLVAEDSALDRVSKKLGIE